MLPAYRRFPFFRQFYSAQVYFDSLTAREPSECTRASARKKKKSMFVYFSLFPITTHLNFRSMNPPPCFFPYAHSKISKEKTESLWTGYSRSPVMNYSQHETKQLRSAWEYVTIDFTYRPDKTVHSCSRAYLFRKKFSRTTFLSMTLVCLCFVQEPSNPSCQFKDPSLSVQTDTRDLKIRRWGAGQRVA